MHARTKGSLARWVGAGLIDAATAARIAEFEERERPRREGRWPVILALVFGGVLLGAGVLLFVSAHWDGLSPAGRFALVLAMVAVFHAGGALAHGNAALASVLHAVGTVALGAGIFLAGQIFHLQEHWPGGVMLWALGAASGWALLRDWPQAAALALLVPAWLVGEWVVATEGLEGNGRILNQGIVVLASVYLTARVPGREGAARVALAWIGGVALLPAIFLAVELSGFSFTGADLPRDLEIIGWTVGLLPALGLAVLLRGRRAWMNGVAAAWAVVLAALAGREGIEAELALYTWFAIGSIILVLWGVAEARRERINLGIIGFGLTVAFFYFSSVMDKLGRSASLIGLGLLFLVGGWLLERTRRRLIARLEGGLT